MLQARFTYITILFIASVILSGCGDTDAFDGKKNNNLFPIYGVTLGQTTTEDIEKIATHTEMLDDATSKPYPYYKINELSFWYDEDTKIVTRVNLVKVNPIPDKWRTIGFSWEKSYNQYLVLFKKMGCPVSFTNNPTVEEFNGHDSFKADLTAYKEEKYPLEIKLIFAYGSGVEAKDQNTLYSIRIAYNN